MAYYREHLYLFFFGICRLFQRRNVLAQLLSSAPSPGAPPRPPVLACSSSPSPSVARPRSDLQAGCERSASASRALGAGARSTPFRPPPVSPSCLFPLVPYELNWLATLRLSLFASRLLRAAERERRAHAKALNRQSPLASASPVSASAAPDAPVSEGALAAAQALDCAANALRLIRACQIVRPSWLARTLAEYPLERKLDKFIAKNCASVPAVPTPGASRVSGAAGAAVREALQRARDPDSKPTRVQTEGAGSKADSCGLMEEVERQTSEALLLRRVEDYRRGTGASEESRKLEETVIAMAEKLRRDAARWLGRNETFRVSAASLPPASRAALEAVYTTKQNEILLRPGNFEKVVALLPSRDLRQAWTAFCFPSQNRAGAARSAFSEGVASAGVSLSASRRAKLEKRRRQLAEALLAILRLQKTCAEKAGFPSWGIMRLDALVGLRRPLPGDPLSPQATEGEEKTTAAGGLEALGGASAGWAPQRRDRDHSGQRCRVVNQRAAEGARGEGERGEAMKALEEQILRLFSQIQREMKKGTRGVDELEKRVEKAVEQTRREREREENWMRQLGGGALAAKAAKHAHKLSKMERLDMAEWLFAANKILKRPGVDMRSSRFFSLNDTLPKLVALTEELHGVRLVSLRGKAWKGFGRSFVGMPYLSDIFAVFDTDAAPTAAPLLSLQPSPAAAGAASAGTSSPSVLDSLLVSSYGPQASALFPLLPADSSLSSSAFRSPSFASLLASAPSFRGFLYFFPCEPLRLSHHFRSFAAPPIPSPAASLVAPGHAFAHGRLAPGPAGPDADRPLNLQELGILLQVLTSGLNALLSSQRTRDGWRASLAACARLADFTGRQDGDRALQAAPMASAERGSRRSEPTAAKENSAEGALGEAQAEPGAALRTRELRGHIVAQTGQLDIPLPLDVQQSFAFLAELLLQEPARLQELACDANARGQAKRMSDDEARAQRPTMIEFLSLNGFFVHAFLDFHLHVTFDPRGATPETVETFIRAKLESILPYKLPEDFDIFSLPSLQNYSGLLAGTGVSYLLAQARSSLFLRELRSFEKRRRDEKKASPQSASASRKGSSAKASGPVAARSNAEKKREKEKKPNINLRVIKSLFWAPEAGAERSWPDSLVANMKKIIEADDEQVLNDGITDVIRDVYGAAGDTK
ncbi:hypothetical protein BESB_056810 [Besnoitia besnoiti]|uniref:Uncharacterized protein n=1 Tax=Besnoitia besnoiti TaxID=94643 RepID=A0A2A9MKS4_BESBE|nr:hypothetical protein BESB_056810 [Besnoitia besnoiti]PFH36030.1 hypothetical protein BESB_056810 [Besnoitia besnoiti]